MESLPNSPPEHSEHGREAGAFARNFSVLAANNVLSPFASVALVLVISRLQGAEVLGKYSIVMTFFALAQSCVSLGLPIIITREVARSHTHAAAYLVNGSLVSFCMLLPILSVLGLVELADPQETDIRVSLAVLGIALVPSVVTACCESILLAFQHAEDFVAIGLVENLVRAAVGSILVLQGHGIVALSLSVLILRFVAAGILLTALRRRGAHVLERPSVSLCKRLIRQGPVVGAIPIVSALHGRSDILLLTWFSGLTEVGYYSAALRLLDVTRALPQGFGRAVYPILSRLHGNRPEHFRIVCRESVRAIAVIMVGVALLLWGLSSQLITLIYGPGFERAAAALHVLSWNVVPFSLTVLLAHVLFAAGRQAADLWVNVIATAVSVTLNCVLIPRYGCLGASWTALLSMLLHVVFQYAFVRGVVQPQVGAQLARIGGAALMAAVATALAGDLALLPKAALLLTAYGAGLLVVGVVTRRDANALRTALAQALPRWGTVEP